MATSKHAAKASYAAARDHFLEKEVEKEAKKSPQEKSTVKCTRERRARARERERERM